MKKIILLLLLLLIAAPPVSWKMKDERRADVVIVDASVTGEECRQHAGLVWLLEQMRIQNPEGRQHVLHDFYGYFPFRQDEVRRLEPVFLEGTDLLYIADTAGVWRSSLEDFELLRDRDRDEIKHSGLARSEVRAITEYIDNGGLAVGEALLFAGRYEGGIPTRRELEEAFGVTWTGWVGGWFKDLNNVKQVPFWCRALYERMTGNLWEFRGSGVLLFNEARNEFFVLTYGAEMREPRPEIIITRRDQALSGAVESGVPQWGWFEVVEAINPEGVRALIRLNLSTSGQQVLESKGLPSSFPAVVSQYLGRETYYLAVDLSYVPTWLGPVQVNWMPEIRATLASLVESQFQGEEAFWTFYIPFLRNLFEQIAH